FGSLNMIPDVTPNGVFYLPPTGWLTSFYNPPFNYYSCLRGFINKATLGPSYTLPHIPEPFFLTFDRHSRGQPLFLTELYLDCLRI
ncbi:hypothetical protein LMB73_02795, partial [Limosilactobacillus reuteri]|nr:hypothetical protein [Limosilactobacillus reuteri]MCC4463612.1 hypothetical protein [Limosilactobacillus reuteri]